MSNDAERIKRFIQEGDANNREIFENLAELRGKFRAQITSELTNIRLYMTALQYDPDISMSIMQTGINLTATLCKHHGWDVKEVCADIDIMFNAKTLIK